MPECELLKSINQLTIKMTENSTGTPQDLTKLGPDKTRLLLLGLNLLNKGLKLPCAVVKPQAKSPAPEKQASSELMEKLKNSPQKLSSLCEDGTETRKRKRDPATDDAAEVGKREKRKMMNRVSAQNARDRKKAYIEDLEKKVALLEEKNKALEKENTLLKNQTTVLSQENVQLEQRLSETTMTSQGDALQALLKETLLQEPFAQGSAAPQNKVSLQQKQFLKKWLLFQIVLAFNLSFWQPSLLTSAQKELLLQLDNMEECPVPIMTYSSNHQPLLRASPWWGAANSKWNPPKN